MKDDKQKIQYTKIIIMMVLVWAMFIVSASYILAALDYDAHEELSIRIVELIIIAIVTYCLKALVEKKDARHNQ